MSRLNSIIASVGGASQPLGVWAVDPRGQGSAAAVVAQNQAELARVALSAPVLVDTIRIMNGATIAGNVDVGVYRFNGTDYVRLASSGSVAHAGSGASQALTLTSPVWVQDGDYLAFASDSATASFRQIAHLAGSLVGTPMNLSLLKASSFPLPATISSPSAGTRTVVSVGYKA